MKLEVGKKYVDGNGVIWEIFFKHSKTGRLFANRLDNVYEYAVYSDMGHGKNHIHPDLIKEHHEPRPWQEVMGDLLKAYKASNAGYGDLELIKEANQLLNKEKG